MSALKTTAIAAATAISGMFVTTANAQTPGDLMDYYGPKMQDALSQISLPPQGQASTISSFGGIAQSGPNADIVHDIVDEERCGLAARFAENIVADIIVDVAPSSTTGMSANFDQLLDDAIEKVASREQKIQTLCPPKGP